MILIESLSFIQAFADNPETETTVPAQSSDVSTSEDVPGFDSLTFEQIIIYLFGCLIGLFLGQSFSFWKW